MLVLVTISICGELTATWSTRSFFLDGVVSLSALLVCSTCLFTPLL